MNKKIYKQLKKAKEASNDLALLSHKKRVSVLKSLAKALRKNANAIIRANEKDMRKIPVNDPMRDRLMLNKERIDGMAFELESLANMADPLGEIFDTRKRFGLTISRKRVPIGVIGVIYESRPNVTTDVAGICIKSGNAVVLKGGKDGRDSYIAIHKVIKEVLKKEKVNPDIVQFIDPKEKDGALSVMKANGLVDLIVPRGSQGLINFVRDNATVPVIETGAGVCHIFVDESAKLDQSADIIFNAKTQRPSVCNALDTLLVHENIAKEFLPMVASVLIPKEVQIFADAKGYAILKNNYDKSLLKKAKASDYGREFLSLKMSVKIINGLDEALTHIKKYSSKHSESILSENKKNLERFLDEVDAAVVYSNSSTRFSDGAVFGLGSEIGISTSKIHARGPMGPREMTTYKWVVSGKYSVRK